MKTVDKLLALWLLAGVPVALGQESGWRLVWQDDFERSEIGNAWAVGEGASILAGQLRLEGVQQATIVRAFKPDVRLEFEARSLPGVPPCDLSATLACGPRLPRGYLLGFGARGNRANHLVGPAIRWVNEDPPFVIEREKLYCLVAQKEGKRLTYQVNGTTIIDQRVEDPLGGPNFDRVGVLTWTGMTVDNVRVYERKAPHPDAPDVMGKLPAGPLFRDGRRLCIRPGHETDELRRAVDVFNAGQLDAALAVFRSFGPTLAGLLGQAYVCGDLNYMEPVYHATFEDLAARFAEASRAAPDDSTLADHAMATRWFSRLVMKRTGSAKVATIRLETLGPQNNPYYDKARLYRLRYQYWDALEGGRRADAQDARRQAQELLKQWPENPILRQYAGQRVPWGSQYLADTERHPAWAALLREAYARDIAIMERFLEVRQQPDGQLGGGYGDDVELMRTWMQIAAISSAAEKVRAGIEKLAEGVWKNVLLEGYDRTLTDVEHSAEPSADSLPGMLLLRYGDPLWVQRNLQSCRTIKTRFMGIDDAGYPRFKCSSFGNLQVGDPLFGGGDTGYCARPMKHFLWAAWQGNPEARDWLVGWSDGWRAASIREIDGKIAGFVPLTLWYPSGSITPPVEGKAWHDERMNYWSRPDMVHDTFLAAYWLTGEAKFLVPFQMTMQLATRGPLPAGDTQRGSRQWQLAYLAHLPHNMKAEQHKVGLYRWLTGDRTYDEYAWHTADASLKYYLRGDLEAYLSRFEAAAQSGRYNLEMQTSEVMATDRADVPAALTIFGAYTGAITGMRDMAIPTFAVTYDTPSTDFAALVVHASRQRLRVWLYNFAEKPMPIGLRLWRLRPGIYVLEQGRQMKGTFEGQHRYAWQEPKQVRIVHRGFGPTVEVPPGEVWAVDLRLKEPVQLPEKAPDLAVHPRGVRLEQDAAVVTVHNIGNADAGTFDVHVSVKEREGWRPIAGESMDGLAASTDLRASSKTIRIKLPPQIRQREFRVRLDLVDGEHELNSANNACVFDRL